MSEPLVTKTHLRALFPRLTDLAIAGYIDPLNAALREFTINTPVRMAAFLAQLAHESEGLRTWIENLHYRPEQLAKLFPGRCRDSHGMPNQGAIDACRRGEEAVASLIYDEREDLGNIEPGDGWRFRGRGPIQITGRANYERTGRLLQANLLAQPELLETPEYGFRSAGLYWITHGLNEFADRNTEGSFQIITRRINGGLVGYESRHKHWREARAVFELPPIGDAVTSPAVNA